MKEQTVTDSKDQKTTSDKSSRGRRNPKRQKKTAGYTPRFMGTNDFEWYNLFPELTKGAANLQFNLPLGSPLKVLPNNFCKGNNPRFGEVYQPGICVLNVAPAWGAAETNRNDPINISAQALYSYVRHANSGSRNYDTPDLMITELAMTQVYSYINWMMRVYGTFKMYSVTHRYLGRTLVQAQGVDYDSIVGRLADFAYYINTFIHQASAFAVPADMTIFKRTAFLFKNFYMEKVGIKSQLYMMNPATFYKYSFNMDDPTGASYLEALDFPAYGAWETKMYMTLDQIIAFGEQLIRPLLDSEDIGIITGDIIKAYGDNLIKVTDMSQDFVASIITDATVMEQIKNATLVGDFYTYPKLIQNATRTGLCVDTTKAALMHDCANDSVEQRYAWYSKIGALQGNKILTTENALNTETVMENTRLMAIAYNVDCWGTIDDPKAGFKIKADLLCGTEVAITCVMWRIGPDNMGNLAVMLADSDGSFSAGGYTLAAVAAKNQFKYYPMQVLVSIENSTSHVLGVRGELDDVTLVDEDELKRIHEAALYSMLCGKKSAAYVSLTTNK